MTIYVDVIFLENLIINYIILYTTAIIAKIKLKYLKILFGSLIGAIYSIIYYILNITIYSNFVVKIVLSVIIIYISFTPKDIKNLFKQVLYFYLVSFVFAGAALGIIYMVNSQNINIQNGVLIGDYTIITILIGIIIAYIITVFTFKLIKSKISKKDLVCAISIKIKGEKVETKAMVDTGNLLREPITGTAVVVMEHTLFYNVIPKEILNNIENILGGDLSQIPENIRNEYISKLKVIPFSSLGKQNGMLLGIKADCIEINYKDEIIKKDNIIIGIYNKSLTKRGEYRSLIGIDFLNC